MLRSVAGGSAVHSSHPAAHETDTRTLRTIEGGSSPSVVIDDDDAVLNVTVRAGTTIGVREQPLRGGWFHHGDPPLQIEKTADGVRIVREAGHLTFEIRSGRRELDVVVPPQARLDVRNAGATTVAGLRAAAMLHSDDGPIAISDHVGDLRVTSDNGRVALRDVTAPSVSVTTDNGRVTLDRVEADRAAVSADNGRIDVMHSLLRGGKIQTDTGRIQLGLDARSDVTISAQTSSGKVVAESPFSLAPEAAATGGAATIRIGNGAGRLEVGTDDGSITITAEGYKEV